MSWGRRLSAAALAGCVLLSAAPRAGALSCAAPEYWYDDGEHLTGDVLVIEGQGWARGSDEECDSSPFGDIRIHLTAAAGDRVLVARGAADDDGRFVAAVRIPRMPSGNVRVEVAAFASANTEIAGVTTSSPLRVRERVAADAPVQPTTFGPADSDPAVWPWIVAAVVASAAAAAVGMWRIDRYRARRVATRSAARHDHDESAREARVPTR